MSIRKSAFWLRDNILGNVIGKNLAEIAFIIENYNTSAASERRALLLRNIINHAVSTTPFYRDLKVRGSILEFPVINKNIIRDNFDSFRSESFKGVQLLQMTTSGSTGTPFTIYQDLNKKRRNYADTLYFGQMAGYELGHELYYMKIWSENNKKGTLLSWLQNIKPIDVLRFDDSVIARLIYDIEKGRSYKSLLGYASAFDMIVNYLNKSHHLTIKSKIKSAVSISETLNPITRQEISRYFDTKAVSRYSNLENGILAQQCKNNDEFHINAASYVVEILELEKDDPAKPGVSGRIVITDLFNYAMPMIRYDTGDIGVYSEEPECALKSPCLKRIEGRKLDSLFDTSGNLISSYLVYKNMWKYTEIKQYQLIQEGAKDYKFVININEPFKREDSLIQEFKSYLGHDAHFKVEYVSEIPLLSSGKRRKIVNNYIRS